MNIQQALDALTTLERTSRAKHGLPPDHLLDWSQYPFSFAKQQLAQLSEQVDAVVRFQPGGEHLEGINAFLTAARGDYAGADEAMRRFQALEPHNPIARIRLTERSASQEAFPPVLGSWPHDPSLFIVCDPSYFTQFAIPLLKSIARHAAGARVHIHVMGLQPTGHLPPGLNITVTHEDPAQFIASRRIQPANYYHSARFVRFAEALEKSPTLLMMDADCIATGDPRPLLDGRSAAARVRAGRIEPWNQLSACLVRGTEASRSYFCAAANVVRLHIAHPFWGLDQYALFSAYLQERPEIELLGPDVASVAADTPGLFWYTAGKRKEILAEGETAFAQLYRSYL